MRWLAAVAVAIILAGCAAIRPEPAATSIAPAATDEVARAASAVDGFGAERLVAVPPASRAKQPVLDAVFRVPLVADHCADRDLPSPKSTDATFTVLDRSYALSPTYTPPDLVPASDAGFDASSAAKLVSGVIVDDLAAMRSAWLSEGLELSVESGYRSYAAQAATFELWSARLGREGALERTARPGHSEHQLGTAIDFTSPGWSGRVGDWATESREGAWMRQHAWQFGFVMSYPSGSQADTCFGYEPWHYRWIGREAAADQRGAGEELRQFLERFVTP